MSRSEIINSVTQRGGKIKRNELEQKFSPTVVAQEVSRGSPLYASSEPSGTKWIEVRLDGLKLCKRHCSGKDCDEANCADLHVCKFHILSKCTFPGNKCKFGHEMVSSHNRSILERHGLADLSHSALQSLFRNNRTKVTRPLACEDYNNEVGCTKPTSGNKACHNLHVCRFFLQDDCKFGSACKRSHDLVTDEHTKRILQQFGIVSSTNDDILKNFQENRAGSIARNDSSSHQDSGDRRQQNLGRIQRDSSEQASRSSAFSSSVKSPKRTLARSEKCKEPRICVYHLMGGCSYGAECKNLHSNFPYQWQWKKDKNWQDCESTLNSQLEENFCKPDSISVTLPGNKTVNYEELKLISNGEAQELRRLETVSTAKKNEARLFVTKWLWYFSENNGRWTQYGHQGTCGARTTIGSAEIEERYEEYLQGKHDAKLQFQTEKFKYVINFEEFTQENLTTNYKRDIFRRPSLYVAQAVLDDLKKAPQICTYNLAGKCEYDTKCRNHHSNLPYQWQWKKNEEWQDCTTALNIQLEENFCKRDTTSATLPGKQTVDFKLLKLNSGGETTSLRRLETISTAQAETRMFATKWVWYFEDNNGRWTEYGCQGSSGGKTTMGSSEIEKCYQNYLQGSEPTLQFQVGGFTYELNFQTLQQENMRTHVQRKMFRRPLEFLTTTMVEDKKKKKQSIISGIKMPDEWSKATSASNDYFFEVGKGSPEYEKVAKLFMETLPSANISKIERVQNPELWEDYFRMKEKMKLKRQDNAVVEVERLLFHGTGEDKIRPICQQGFDPRVAGLSTGTLYGCGSYFSSSAEYSHPYTRMSGKMIVASVLVGDYIQGQPSHTRPPPRDISKPYENLYDSVVNNCQNPTIFVIFDIRQVYPNYIVHYSLSQVPNVR